jgi:hypothetical protein
MRDGLAVARVRGLGFRSAVLYLFLISEAWDSGEHLVFDRGNVAMWPGVFRDGEEIDSLSGREYELAVEAANKAVSVSLSQLRRFGLVSTAQEAKFGETAVHHIHVPEVHA